MQTPVCFVLCVMQWGILHLYYLCVRGHTLSAQQYTQLGVYLANIGAPDCRKQCLSLVLTPSY